MLVMRQNQWPWYHAALSSGFQHCFTPPYPYEAFKRDFSMLLYWHASTIATLCSPHPPRRLRRLDAHAFHGQLPRMSSDPRNAPERVYFTRPLQPRDHITAAALQTLHLAASASRHYVGPTSYAYTDARLRLRICAHLSTRRPRAMHSHCCQEELIYTVDGQRMFRRTTSVIVSRISSVLCCRPASVEQTACSPSTYWLCR